MEGEDLNIKDRDGANLTDAVIEAAQGSGEKYSGRDANGYQIDFLAASEASNTFGYSEDLLGGPFDFGIKIDARSALSSASPLSNQEVYALTQYKLRQDSDIEQFGAGSAKTGKLTDELLAFVGSTLTTKFATNVDQAGSKTGTAITNIRTADVNNTQLRDDNNVLQSFPFSTSIDVTFSQDILDDGADAKAFLFYTFTRDYAVGGEIPTSIVISDVGVAASDTSQDSANFTLNGALSPTPLLRTGTPNGLNPSVNADAYFLVHKNSGTGANHNVIWKVTSISDSSNFACITLDDTSRPINETLNTSGDGIRTHPLNSPGALILDSAGASTENNTSERAETTLASGNLSDNTTFKLNYAFDNNSQKDRLNKVGAGDADNVALTVRAIGLGNGTWAQQNATVTRQNVNAISLVSPVERNYSNP